MSGASWYGLVGTSGFCFGQPASPEQLVFFLIQLGLCGTATSIVSAAVGERMRWSSNLLGVGLVASVIYPIVGHWVWGRTPQGEPTGWLASLGFVDFAGATVVHAVGGAVALATVLLVGPRTGRFNAKHSGRAELQRQYPSRHDAALSGVGVFLLWFGWFGLHGGSDLEFSERVPLYLLNTALAGACGGMTRLVASWTLSLPARVEHLVHGIIAGLVGIAAACHIMLPWQSALVGCTAALVSATAALLLERLKIDDVVGAVPVHLCAGVWGTLAVALVASPDAWGTGLTRWQQFAVQLTGAGACGAWAFGVALIGLAMVNGIHPLRRAAGADQCGIAVWPGGESRQRLETAAVGHSTAEAIVGDDHSLDPSAQSIADIEETHRRYAAMLNAALDAVVGIDVNGYIVDWNQRAEEMFGWRRHEALGRQLSETIVPVALRTAYQKGLCQCRAYGSSRVLNRRVVVQGLRRDGSEFPLELAVIPVSFAEVTRYYGFIRDLATCSSQADADDTTELSQFILDELQQISSDSQARSGEVEPLVERV